MNDRPAAPGFDHSGYAVEVPPSSAFEIDRSAIDALHAAVVWLEQPGNVDRLADGGVTSAWEAAPAAPAEPLQWSGAGDFLRVATVPKWREWAGRRDGLLAGTVDDAADENPGENPVFAMRAALPLQTGHGLPSLSALPAVILLSSDRDEAAVRLQNCWVTLDHALPLVVEESATGLSASFGWSTAEKPGLQDHSAGDGADGVEAAAAAATAAADGGARCSSERRRPREAARVATARR